MNGFLACRCGHLVVAAVLCVAAVPSPALAGEDDRALSLETGAILIATLQADIGWGVGVEYEHGVKEQLAVIARAGGSVVASDSTSFGGHAVAGARVLISDIVQYILHVEAVVGPEFARANDINDLGARLEVGFGVDKLTSRASSLGIQLRFSTCTLGCERPHSGLILVGRWTRRWGFF